MSFPEPPPAVEPRTRARARRARLAEEATTRAGRSAVLGLMLVALTAGMLALSGTTPRGIGTPVGEVNRVALDQRTFVCDGKLPGTRVRRGTIVGGPRATVKVTAPLAVDVASDVARGAFAAEQAEAARWAAWQPCPEAQARWWFVGAGGASVTHDTVLTIVNPRAGAAVLDVDVYGPRGPVEAPGLHGLTVAGGATRTLDLATVAPGTGDLAVSVVARRGLVAVSATDTFSPGAIGKQVREWIPATTTPAKVVTLAGLPSRPSAATLLLANPGDVEVIAEVEVIGSGSTFTPQDVLPVALPPRSVRPVPVSAAFDGKPVAFRVTGTGPLTGTVRVTRRNDIAFAAGVRTIRGATAVAVPPGSGRQLVLSSLGEAGSVTITGYDARAERVLEKVVEVLAGTSVAVRLVRGLSYLRLATGSDGLVAGLSSNGRTGLMTAGVSPAIRSIRLPVVRNGW